MKPYTQKQESEWLNLLGLKINFVFNLWFIRGADTADRLVDITRGKVKIEDAGFNPTIIGPDVQHVDHVAAQSEMDAFCAGGQKCSALSFTLMHKNW